MAVLEVWPACEYFIEPIEELPAGSLKADGVLGAFVLLRSFGSSLRSRRALSLGMLSIESTTNLEMEPFYFLRLCRKRKKTVRPIKSIPTRHPATAPAMIPVADPCTRVGTTLEPMLLTLEPSDLLLSSRSNCGLNRDNKHSRKCWRTIEDLYRVYCQTRDVATIPTINEG